MSDYERILENVLLTGSTNDFTALKELVCKGEKTIPVASCMSFLYSAKEPSALDANLVLSLVENGIVSGFENRCPADAWSAGCTSARNWTGFGLAVRPGNLSATRETREWTAGLLKSWMRQPVFWAHGETDFMMSLDDEERCWALRFLSENLPSDVFASRCSGFVEYGVIFQDMSFLDEFDVLLGLKETESGKSLFHYLAMNFSEEEEREFGNTRVLLIAERLHSLGCDFRRRDADGKMPFELTSSPSLRAFLEKGAFSLKIEGFSRRKVVQP